MPCGAEMEVTVVRVGPVALGLPSLPVFGTLTKGLVVRPLTRFDNPRSPVYELVGRLAACAVAFLPSSMEVVSMPSPAQSAATGVDAAGAGTPWLSSGERSASAPLARKPDRSGAKRADEGIERIWSVNEWGRLYEVIVGDPRGGFLPSMRDISQRSFDRVSEEDLSKLRTGSMPEWVVEETLEDLEGLVGVLHSHGVRVHRAQPLDCTLPVETPAWQADQETSINIRDLTLIHGDLVIDAPSPTRGRYWEGFAVRELFDDYRRRSDHAWFVAPPRPRLPDCAYDLARPQGIREVEPLFDASNCVRLGRDIVIDINNTANRAGARWIQQTLDRHFGTNAVKVHCASLSSDHLDVVVVPLCEGRALVNPQYVKSGPVADCLAGWDLIAAPEMVAQSFHAVRDKASDWIGMNLLVLDGEEKTVLVEERQTPLLHLLALRGFRPAPVRWRHGRIWGGGFHCITLDVHRAGGL